MGLGRVKTPARHDGVELCSHWPTVQSPRAGLASRWPLAGAAENQQTQRFMHFRCVAHVPQSILLRAHRRRDLMASWNRILPIFDPHTFLHNQGQKRTSVSLLRNVYLSLKADVLEHSCKCRLRLLVPAAPPKLEFFVVRAVALAP